MLVKAHYPREYNFLKTDTHTKHTCWMLRVLKTVHCMDYQSKRLSIHWNAPAMKGELKQMQETRICEIVMHLEVHHQLLLVD